ncbi:MAG: hypothetical protein HFH60_08850 [Lachnospiraceae bacterium]|nr:hypothetical protein [Lachnospiraceae bacterium]
MNEKIYKTISQAGVMNLTIGIAISIIGLASGVLMIVNGARLLKRKYEITI